MKIQEELYKLGHYFNNNESPAAREVYNNFAYLLILDEPLGEQSDLEKIWESIKE